MVLQWHVTERCNLRCLHCYQQDPMPADLDATSQALVVSQFSALVTTLERDLGMPVRGRITVTGGEPLLYDGLPSLLERIVAERRWTGFALLTNGTLVDAAVSKWLGRLQPDYVQISIDGSENTHDRLRGRGSYRSAVLGLKHLHRNGVRTSISFTANVENYREFSDVARLGFAVGAGRVWVDRMVPVGRGQHATVLLPGQTHELFERMLEARAEGLRRRRRTHIAMHRALQFLAAGGDPYRCSAGSRLLALTPDGRVFPCRRMPIEAGNIDRTPLDEIYRSSPILARLRDEAAVPAACRPCRYARACSGGSRCLALATRGDPLASDPGCVHAQSAIDKSLLASG